MTNRPCLCDALDVAEDAVNNLALDAREINALKNDLSCINPTVQQNLMRYFVLPLIEKWAFMYRSNQCDTRNMATCFLSFEMLKNVDKQDMVLPVVTY